MTKQKYLLAIDQGTTSSRAILFDKEGKPHGRAQRELAQIYPRDGWVEHDAEEIWRATLETCRQVISQPASIAAESIAAIGIANQRETVIIWRRGDGQPIHNAIVWQDRRGAELCDRLAAEGCEAMVRGKTGLLLDAYFSASKIAWLLDNLAGARQAAERGELAFGTVDSFLLWRLTAGRVHATDATNAARTMLYNIHNQDWDGELLELFRIPRQLLPEVRDNSSEFGVTDGQLFGGEIAITGIAGDQQAAAIGQACFRPGMIKATFGTGCFILQNIGEEPALSDKRLVTTLAYRLDGKPSYAVEGSIFNAGAALQWLRDGLRIIGHASESEAHARSIADTGGVYLVPAFTGLGAPYWDGEARGAILGLTRDSGVAHITRAALESVCYQTRDLIIAMAEDGTAKPSALRVDGGMAGNDWLMQFLADILDLPVERPAMIETTALGAAYLAGLKTGFYSSIADISEGWQCERIFRSSMDAGERQRLCAGWRDAVRRVRGRNEKS